MSSMAFDRTAQVALGEVGRRFRVQRSVRLGDVAPNGELRLDALTRYTQDVSNDDTTDAALADDLAWVVRRTVVDTVQPAQFQEQLELTTFCSGLGKRWAERRITIRGERGAAYEVATLWIHLDPSTGRPRLLSEQFLSLYGSAAQGRTIGARQAIGKPPDDVDWNPWPLRAVDFDLFNHVNNAVYWAAVHQVHQERPERFVSPHRAVVEYGAGIGPDASVELAVHDVERRDREDSASNNVDGTLLWWRADGGAAAAAALYRL